MSTLRFEGLRWPDRQELLLLKAALLDREPALAAWQAWRRTGDIDAVDRPSYEILPLLYRNFEKLGIDDPDFGRLKGIYRRTWYQNQVLIRHAASVIDVLGHARIEAMVLKGAAAMELHYHDHGIRPMHDVDILVPTLMARQAVRVIEEAGWKPHPDPSRPVERDIGVLHGAGFVNGQGGSVDLHWHALEECCQDDADDDFWAASRPIALNGVAARAQCATDLFLHVCVHGSRGQPDHVIRWVADALTILHDSTPPIDWERLVSQTSRRQLSVAVGESLRYLAETFGAPVPAGVLERLKRMPVSWIERIDYRAQGAPPTVYWAVAHDTARYLRMSSGRPLARRAAGFPRYLAGLWQLEHTWQAPFEAVRRVGRRLRETRYRPWRPIARR
jgi:hypothetical protein